MSFFDRIGGNRLTSLRRNILSHVHPAARPATPAAARNTARPATTGRSSFTAASATARRTPGRTSAAAARQAARARSGASAAPARQPQSHGLFGGLLHKAASAARKATQTASRITRSVRQGSSQLQHAAQHGLQRAKSVGHEVSARVNANPVAKALKRTGGFAHRALGHAENFQKLTDGVKGLSDKAHTSVRDVRQAVKSRSFGDISKAYHSVADTVKSGKEVVAHATQARESLRAIKNDFAKTFPTTAGRLANQYKRASTAAGNVARRLGVDRAASTVKRLTSRITHNPTAKAFQRTAGFAQRTLGSAHTLVEFGGKVKQLAGKTRTAASDIRTAIRNRSLSDAGTALKSSWDAVKSAKDVVTGSREAREALRSIKNDFKKTFPKTASRLGAQYQKAASAAGNVAKKLGLGNLAAGGGKSFLGKLVSRATQSPVGKALQRVKQNSRAIGAAGGQLLKLGQGVYGAATKAPGAIRDIRQAIKTRTAEDVNKALSSTKGVLTSVKDIAEAAPKARQALRVLGKVAQRVAPKVSARVAEVAGKVAARAGGKVLTKVAGKVAGSAVAKAGAKALGKAAGRFAPGVNIAMAAIDTASFVNTLRDPKASVGAKITSGVTALGSIAAATNIPIVSQVGAGVSMVSSFIGGLF
ncbi:hypothetical protein [Archangium sp.]|uniref:hypothetical protein n=1 Tax=Archangium sp. TaxID=1872627 RepID=UPI00389AF3E5